MKLDNQNDLPEQDEAIDIKKIIYLLIRQWHWFVLFGMLGLIGAYAYTRLTNPSFSVSSSVLIPQSSNGFSMENLFDAGFEQNSSEIYNQIEILKSSFTIKKTMLALNWRTNWYQQEIFLWNGIYKSEPFVVREPDGFVNPSGIKLFITPIDDQSYNLSATGSLKFKGIKTEIDFEARGEYGQVFKNQYFHFTLHEKENGAPAVGENYYFVFNDLGQSTLSYQKRLNAAMKDEYCDIVVCSIAGEEPEKESDFINKLLEVYMFQKLEYQNEAQRRSLEFIDTQLTGISDSLNISGNKLTGFRSRNEIIDLGAEGTLVMNNLTAIETEKARSQVQLDYFRNVLSYLEKSGDLTKLVSPSVVGIEDASLNMLVVKLGELYNRRQILSFTARETNPSLVMLDRELAQTRKQLDENLRNLIQNASQSINSMNERQNMISARLNLLPAKEQQMINIQRQFNLTNEIYTFLLQKRAETKIALASSISDVKIIEPANPETANRMGLAGKMVMFIGFFLGLAVPAGAILLVNFFDTRILTQEDIENHTQLPIIGNIMHSSEGSELTVFEKPKSNIAESFRDLRTNLEFMLTGQQAKVISIHSTNPGEGKSYNSINLGTILALNGNKVLLIGADMRKPRLHKIFNISNKKGLSTYLIGHDSFDEVISPSAIENLRVLPSGPIPPNPSEILGKPTMKELIEKARAQFDYIILDNAPVGMVTDGIIVSRLSDLNIFVLRFGLSHKHQLEMINQFAATILVNDIKASSFGKSYYKYYQYEAYKKTYYSEAENEKEGLHKKAV